MPNVTVTNKVGNELIASDLKRLKKINSLEKDLDTYFIAHQNTLSQFGHLSCEIAPCKDYIICKDRIATANPFRPPSKGGRLWFVITKSGYYIRCLLYLADEEDTYKKSVCFKLVTERLNSIS